MLAFKREAVAPRVLFSCSWSANPGIEIASAHTFAAPKEVEAKAMILLQIALRQTRRVRRAWLWPRNQFWFETLLNGNLVQKWWKENFRISRRRTFENLVSKTRSNDTDAMCGSRKYPYPPHGGSRNFLGVGGSKKDKFPKGRGVHLEFFFPEGLKCDQINT